MSHEMQMIALRVVAKNAAERSDWQDYSSYCTLREKGLRKQALQKLETFLNLTDRWELSQRTDFTTFLFTQFETIKYAQDLAFPHSLKVSLIKQTLENWCDIEEGDSRPFRWYGKYFNSIDHLKKALQVCPEDDIAREGLLKFWSDCLYSSMHHLPVGYLGNPEEDLQLVIDQKNQIVKLADKARREYWISENEVDEEIINNYLTWKKSGHPDFGKWGEEKNQRVGYGTVRIYPYKK